MGSFSLPLIAAAESIPEGDYQYLMHSCTTPELDNLISEVIDHAVDSLDHAFASTLTSAPIFHRRDRLLDPRGPPDTD
jgi:hypothetical protein